jgi:hypothetical protein
VRNAFKRFVVVGFIGTGAALVGLFLISAGPMVATGALSGVCVGGSPAIAAGPSTAVVSSIGGNFSGATNAGSNGSALTATLGPVGSGGTTTGPVASGAPSATGSGEEGPISSSVPSSGIPLINVNLPVEVGTNGSIGEASGSGSLINVDAPVSALNNGPTSAGTSGSGSLINVDAPVPALNNQ